jgi:hypothetical protein
MKFVLFYKGPAAPPDASHKGWMTWFDKLGDALVDIGSPIANGVVVHNNGSATDCDPTVTLNGYSVIRAKDRNEALELIKDHPYLGLGSDYTIEIFERKR